MRDFLNRNPAVVTGALVLVLGISLYMIFNQFMGQRTPTRFTYSYFYDLETGDMFVDKSSLLAPINDGKGVKAVVFSCGKCETKSTHFIGWVEKYTDAAKQAFNTPAEQTMTGGPEMMQVIEQGHLIAPPPKKGEVPTWVPMNSPQGTQVMQMIRGQCTGSGSDSGQPTACAPLKSELP